MSSVCHCKHVLLLQGQSKLCWWAHCRTARWPLLGALFQGIHAVEPMGTRPCFPKLLRPWVQLQPDSCLLVGDQEGSIHRFPSPPSAQYIATGCWAMPLCGRSHGQGPCCKRTHVTCARLGPEGPSLGW